MSNEASSKFDKLIATLQELELTGTEIADILWLAQQSQITLAENSGTPQQIDEAKKAHTKPTTKNNTPETKTTPAVSPQPPEPKAEVYAKSSLSTSSSSSSDTLEIKVPDARGLREPLKLARALRPLMQKIDSQTEVILDEEATANRIAKERIRNPVFQPAQEPAFDLVLVFDESNTMIFWRKTIQELQQLLEIQGAFRDVQVWGLRTNQQGDIYLRRGTGKTSLKHRQYKPSYLTDPSGKRLFLVASDCVDDIWRNGKAFEMLKIWTQQNLVAIVQMLPQWLWQRTGLSFGAKVQFGSLTPRIANQGLLIKQILLWDDIDFRTGTKIPIFTLEEDSARTWSKMIAGRSDANVTGFIFSSDFTPLEEISPTPETQEEETTEEITSNFRRAASPIARKLASLLSAAPVITLPIVRIIQEQMLKKSQQVHVAEVFLGGILKRKQEITLETNPDEIEFDFISEEVRDNFLQAAPVTDSLEIIDAISRYFAKKLNKSFTEFNVLLRNPQQANNEKIDIDIKPFAFLTAKVLKRLGGDYSQFAEELEQEWNNSDTTLRNSPTKLTSSEKTSSPDTDIQQKSLPSSLSNQQRKQLQDALIDAFPSTASLEEMLLFELDKDLGAIATLQAFEVDRNLGLENIVFKLIQTAESQGWLEELFRAARAVNPGNSQLMNISEQLLNSAPEGLSGRQRRQLLQDALIDAFPTVASLEQMLAFRLGKNLRRIAGLETIVFKLMQTANSEGWLEELIRAAYRGNPGNSQLMSISEQLLNSAPEGLSGRQRKQLYDALIDAFPSTASLEQMLLFELHKNLRAIIKERRLEVEDIVFKLIQTAESEGWLEELLRAARDVNPRNSRLMNISEQLLNSTPETLHNIRQQQSHYPRKILILAPFSGGLRSDEEIRNIHEAIQSSRNRELFKIQVGRALRPQDIRRVIAEYRPFIVHFYGHSMEDSSLLLEDGAGENKPISPQGLASLFELFADDVKCVILNAAYSDTSAEAISQHIDYVIGMNQSIGDKAALAFSQGFYEGLGYINANNPDLFQRAFNEGIIAIKLEDLSEASLPVLKKKSETT